MQEPTVDSHHHFWTNPSEESYPWMTDDLAAIRRTFGPDELRPLLAESAVQYTVLVQTRPNLEETRAFLELAANKDFVAGVVWWVDLTDPAVDSVLRDLKDGPGGQLLVGIRHQVHDETDSTWLIREDVLRGLRAVDDAHLAYDLLIRPRELAPAREVARRLPCLRLVVDHIAKPRIKAREIEEWAGGLAPLAEHPQVHCKLSGMVTEADWSRWTAGDFVPYVVRALAWFGTERVMFGSDWPVYLLAASYQEAVDTRRTLLASLPHDERDDIFGANAIGFYQIEVPRRHEASGT